MYLGQIKEAGTANKFTVEIISLSSWQNSEALDQPVHEKKNSLTGL